MNTTQTLTNAQLFLSTKLITRLEHTSPDEFSHVNSEELLANIMCKLNDFSPKDESDIHYLRERITDQLDQADCIIKQVAAVLNALILLTIYAQKNGSNPTIFNITNGILQSLVSHTDYI